MSRHLFSLVVIFAALPVVAAAPPVVADPRLVLELVAEQPEIVTPTGVAVDAKGRVFVLENQTHQRTPEYKGPPTDRVRVFDDFDAAGRARRVTTFTDGFKDSMGLTFGPDGAMYLATRAAIYKFPDAVNPIAGPHDKRVIVQLKTKGNYPHNGLSGFAWAPDGGLVFGLGENLGESYSLVGSDGSTLTGGGEGGSVYKCRPDGSELERIATGFWNPYGLAYDAAGRLFAVDNDPDARGPCRLLHVVQGGDYGYRFRYGRKGIHPFVCWNGELPGTLPMVAGTSEAPSGVQPCDFTSLPADLGGELLVTSWGDHTIERFKLSPRGASVSAVSKVVVRGDENFRPVAFAVAPDGSVVFTDWVDKSYPVHGKGRVWRLRAQPQFSGKPKAPASPGESRSEAEWAAIVKRDVPPSTLMDAILHLRSPEYLKDVIPFLGHDDPFLASAALEVLGRPGHTPMLLAALSAKPQAAWKVGLLLALRRTGEADALSTIPQFLGDPDPAVRRAAIQWAAEAGLKQHAAAVREAAFRTPVTRELVEAWAKAQEMLSDRKLPRNLPEETDVAISSLLATSEKSPEVMAIALRMLPADSPRIHPGTLERFARSSHEGLVMEILRACLFRGDDRSFSAIREALGYTHPPRVHDLALTALANFADREPAQQLLLAYLNNPAHRYEALRSLRGVPKQADAVVKWWESYTRGLPNPTDIDRDLMDQYYFTLRSSKVTADEKPRSAAEWRAVLAKGGGDPVAGERVFFHPRGPGCYKCHKVDNRGAGVGPDLSLIGKALSRDRLIESILEPSKEVAPMFTAWKITTRDGKERVGVIAGETFDSLVTVVDSQGKVEKLRRTHIEERVALPKSIMPDELPNQMTRREFLDLIAFLMDRK